MYKFVDISSLFPNYSQEFLRNCYILCFKDSGQGFRFFFFKQFSGLGWGFWIVLRTIEIQILKQYYAQYYAYVKQNTVNIVILLQLHLVLLKWLIAPVMNWIHYHLLLAFGFIYSGVNFFQEKLLRYFFFCWNYFLVITGKNHKNCKINPSTLMSD